MKNWKILLRKRHLLPSTLATRGIDTGYPDTGYPTLATHTADSGYPNTGYPTLATPILLPLENDANPIIRCKGRLQNSTMAKSAKYPVLIPKHLNLERLIITDV
ncbi:hypothetical protein DAPPUDRAFT_245229 [Daphnia pulex]|uniref:Uncharacterized protein n=1 Tax=Daphnia pulex TaxID=6669 RepID=E9GMU2_DAPPU|nr:hypothetical protein DAPPUDRAFT_245234 [Daphnia pulex]EFX79230.1 hypothetical protein DAPPUDRAFT_245229 [Daphnia pulex]|eukprot:EFX79227.1 hypothetical protein DAPPUDRAFT_245234 [Daphnia pulex]